jgi:prefoldin subunit 5
MKDKGSHDLEEIIKKQKARIEELERDREILIKDIDRLSEYSQNLERLLRQ